jgi:plasmid stabilization system protein ParE
MAQAERSVARLMATFRLTPSARRDINGICSFIAADNLNAADRVFSAIFEACKALGQNPSLGHLDTALTAKPIRFWTLSQFPNYIIVYRKVRTGVQVLRVVHGRRNLRRILKF